MAANKNYLLNDNFPKLIKNATSTSDGLMSSEDKANLDSIFEFGLLTPATPDKDGIMTKEDKIKLDGIEEGANNYVHPDTPEIRHVTDIEKNTWNTQTKYTNNKPTPVTIGGIDAGTTFDNVDHNDLFTRLLYPYIEPTISSISITPSTTILEKGSAFSLTRVRFNITTPSLDSTEAMDYSLKANNNPFYTMSSSNRSVDMTVNLVVNANSIITVTVTDPVNVREKTFTLITYKFIYPMYYGILSENDIITQDLVKSKTKLLQEKGTKTIAFTTNYQKMMFAYPKEYGQLSVINDANNFNVIDTFTIQEIDILSADSNLVPYYVYTNELSTVTNYNMKFTFSDNNTPNSPVEPEEPENTFDESQLIDFTYTTSEGTYTLTGWKGTLNGIPSTEIVVPDNKAIIL